MRPRAWVAWRYLLCGRIVTETAVVARAVELPGAPPSITENALAAHKPGRASPVQSCYIVRFAALAGFTRGPALEAEVTPSMASSTPERRIVLVQGEYLEVSLQQLLRPFVQHVVPRRPLESEPRGRGGGQRHEESSRAHAATQIRKLRL